jgi:hypothetical protein
MISDCLVLKIQEYVDNKLDNTLYVLYDKNEELFLVRGKRKPILGKHDSVPYAFYCKYTEELHDFISLILCISSKISYTLYNYNDLPIDPNNIDFETLDTLSGDKSVELTGFDNQNYSKKDIEKFLRVLKNVFNYYYK